MLELSFILFVGFLLDLIIGDPTYPYHPIRIIGRGISGLEGGLRKHDLDGRCGGILLLLGMECLTLIIYIPIVFLLKYIHPILAGCFNLFIFYSCVALKDLFHHMEPVVAALRLDNLPEARKLLAKVVGRDTHILDKPGIIRAAIETVSENFVDGVLSPLFWFLAGALSAFFLKLDPAPVALSLMLTTKVASTLDSMVGYKNPAYLRFGWAGAKVDDIMTFIPARLSLAILFLGAWVSGLHPVTGLRTALRDRLKHDSPNAAHAESFVAGALNVRLGGPTQYPEGVKNKPWLGEEYPDPDIDQIQLTERLVRTSAWIFVLVMEGTLVATVICR